MKARVLITYDCHRDCHYCCNKYPSMMEGLRVIKSLSDLDKYDEVMITGGEPLLYPDKVFNVAKYLYQKGIKSYLYTTIWKPEFRSLLKVLDGVHYTLHDPLHKDDIRMFHAFQAGIRYTGAGTHRAYIDPKINEVIGFNPSLFIRVESKPWLSEGECVLPEDDLLSLETSNDLDISSSYVDSVLALRDNLTVTV